MGIWKDCGWRWKICRMKDWSGFWSENAGQGHNDYPIRAMWNSLLAGLVYQHPSTTSLIRELQRNVQLRYRDVYYNEQGEAYVYDPLLRTKHLMNCDGYEARRDCLRKQCPVKAFGICCPGYGSYSNQGGVQIPLTTAIGSQIAS